MPSENIKIKVVGRCRPLTPEEIAKGSKSVVNIQGKDKIIINAAGKEQSYSLDSAFGADSKNADIYESKCDALLHRALEGYNITIMAFGATGSGKSYLMSGNEEDPGIVPLLSQKLFQNLKQRTGKEYMVTASFLEIMDEKMLDLLNPHNNPMTLRQHIIKGIFVDGLSEMVVQSAEDLAQLYDQGLHARCIGAADVKAHRERAHAIFTITVEQKEHQSSKIGVRSTITLVELAGCEISESANHTVVAGNQGILKVLSALGDSKQKGGHVPYRESLVTRLLQDSLGGNCITLMLVTVSSRDKAYQETHTALQYAQYTKTIQNHVKMNLDDTQDIISELRHEISKLRNKITSASEPNRDDVAKMEDLIKDLQLAKKQTWEEKERLSGQYEEERKINLANKGVLEWVMDSMKKGSRELQEKILLLQKERDLISEQYKAKRKDVDELKEDLQKKIMDYTKYTESKKSESETKKLVTAIHELKERLKRETEALRKIKDNLSLVQARQQQEREHARAQMTGMKGNAELRQKVELEERKRMEQEHKAMIDEEMEKSKLDVESELAEIQMREADGYKYSTKEGAELERTLAQLRADKPVIAMKLQTMQKEKEYVEAELEDVYRMHNEQLELQQLQHYQTFRRYREMFEEQKAAIDQRYRQLLEDCIQDSVFLSSRNSELATENQSLKQYIAVMKDAITKLGGKIPSAVDLNG
ncbi:chromosome-associated kinesin KIF4A-like isoform X3 [Pomacea canaliculata]|uniref:chromosome-associated kinesin KIF4A-like isoform X3 n=1 Tax=Pomacea canaliculata TaxID=400727 RepID=UPI000D729E04|nr:chromosome-associated kinesin KIF4A-like isoform X3 [Pomacea canaliculata]